MTESDSKATTPLRSCGRPFTSRLLQNSSGNACVTVADSANLNRSVAGLPLGRRGRQQVSRAIGLEGNKAARVDRRAQSNTPGPPLNDAPRAGFFPPRPDHRHYLTVLVHEGG